MSKQPLIKLRQGQIHWLTDCPPLDGDTDKDRPVVICSPPKVLAGQGPILVVAITTKPRRTDADKIEMPNRESAPNCTSGLQRLCWVIPRWFLVIERKRLPSQPSGYVSRNKLQVILAAVENRMVELSLSKNAKKNP